IPVSSATGRGWERLVQASGDMVAQLAPPSDLGRPRLWVDRVFSIRGAGTVVTGTMEGGRLRLDQEVEILPLGRRARVRGLQTHKRAVAEAVPGSRVAVNLAGIDAAGLERGVAVCGPGQRRATAVINAGVRLLPRLDRVPDDLAELMLYVGSAEIACRVRWLEPDALLPGETLMVQLWLTQATPVQFGDRIILRDPARHGTIGGGGAGAAAGLAPAAPQSRSASARLGPGAAAAAGLAASPLAGGRRSGGRVRRACGHPGGGAPGRSPGGVALGGSPPAGSAAGRHGRPRGRRSRGGLALLHDRQGGLGRLCGRGARSLAGVPPALSPAARPSAGDGAHHPRRLGALV